jgi:sugar lactone lactonase YvrE
MVNKSTYSYRRNRAITTGTAFVVFASMTAHLEALEPRITQATQFGGKGTENHQFMIPYGISVHPASGDIFVCDTGKDRIKRFTPYGAFVSAFGCNGTGQGQFRSPQALAFNTSGDSLYVLDTGNHRVQKFDMSQPDPVFSRFWGGEGNGQDQLYFPRDISVDVSGAVYVLDSGNGRIQKYSSSGIYQATFGEALGLKNPYGMDIDNAGNMYIADMENSRVLKIGAAGAPLLEITGKGGGQGQFRYPRDVAVDGSGNIFVADSANYRIQKFDSTGRFRQEFGRFGEFLSPQSFALSPSGRLFVIDSNTHRIQGYDVGSVIVSFASDLSVFSPNADGKDDALVIRFSLNGPATVYINVYDSRGGLVRNLVDGKVSALVVNEENWDGRDGDGTPVPAGVYEIRITAFSAAGSAHSPQSIFVTVAYPSGTPDIRVTPSNLKFSRSL